MHQPIYPGAANNEKSVATLRRKLLQQRQNNSAVCTDLLDRPSWHKGSKFHMRNWFLTHRQCSTLKLGKKSYPNLLRKNWEQISLGPCTKKQNNADSFTKITK
ncbi:hypothetical protein CDAR_472001 [Caerostris darwini]|uniref:Uncharacterized protein n=1 Tax=Caerostris darwini TaxID=1538125 RepID=A0AAV4VLZ0_9ARAC|nr:hypothetical protein CDAR_472001 [Caerostris darwini]